MRFRRISHEVDAIHFHPLPHEEDMVVGVFWETPVTKYPPPTDFGPSERYWFKCPVCDEFKHPYYPSDWIVRFPSGCLEVFKDSVFLETYESSDPPEENR